jgi:hypothetical protein
MVSCHDWNHGESSILYSVEHLVTIVGGTVGAVSGSVAALIAVLSYRNGHRAKPSSEPVDQLLVATANRLALSIQQQWHEEELSRRIHDPFPLPVHWVNGPDSLFDHWSNICHRPATRTSRSLNLAGRLDHVKEIFDRVPSKRIVVLGKAGSGKTILTLRYVLSALDTRQDSEPVPVVLGLASWDALRMPLRDWLIQRLEAEYPALSESVEHGLNLAAALVDAGRILPVLDGFDEIAEELRPAALTALNATSYPFILTSRPDEYRAAVELADVLSAAAGVSIVDLTIDELAAYLPRTTRKLGKDHRGAVTKWDPVLAHLRHDPNTLGTRLVKAALSTPLMVGLARAIYSDTKDRDPAELLDVDRFASLEVLEGYLLDAFIPAVYQHQRDDQYSRRRRDGFTAEDAQRYLGHLAVRLDGLGTRDLAWWQLRDTVSLPGRLLVAGLIGVVGGRVLLAVVWRFGAGLGLGFGVGIAVNRKGRQPIRVRLRLRGRAGQVTGTIIGGVVGGFVGALVGELLLRLTGAEQGLVLGPLAGTANGSAAGLMSLAAGLAAGLIASTIAWAGIRSEASRGTRGGLKLPTWIERSLAASAICLVGGIIGSIALGLAGGLTLGLACGISTGLIMGLETPIDIRTVATPSGLLQADRRNATVCGALLGLAVSLAVVIASWPVIGPLRAFELGLGGGLTQGFGICLAFYAWGHWLAFTRGWLSLTHRLPLALPNFLADAHRNGVLRQAGAVYQFRHARLQDRLAEQWRHISP